MFKKSILIFTTVFVLFSDVMIADESIDNDLGGFEMEEFSDEDIVDSTPVKQEKKSIFSLSGDLAFKTSYGYKNHKVNGIEYSGINQAQTELYLQLDSKLSDNWKMRLSVDMFYDGIYDIKHNGKYLDDIEDDYRTQLMIDDAYIQGRLSDNIDIKIGRQIVVWGKSDSIRVTDVINPLDNRHLGMTDIEDLRLSVGMIKLDYYYEDWDFSFINIFESRIMKEATARSEFFPVDSIFAFAPNPFIDLKTPKNSWDDMQFAMAAKGVFSGWDLSFYGAYVLDQKWHINPKTQKREVNKIKMIGSDINIAIGSWLLKSEVAYLSGIKYNSTEDDKNRIDTLIGIEYMGITDTVISLDVVNRHIFDYEECMNNLVLKPDFVEKNDMQTAIRFTRSFMNDSLNYTALLSMFGSSFKNGGFFRTWVDYEVIDDLSVNFGVVDYIGGDKPYMESIKNNDRVFADITYSF